MFFEKLQKTEKAILKYVAMQKKDDILTLNVVLCGKYGFQLKIRLYSHRYEREKELFLKYTIEIRSGVILGGELRISEQSAEEIF